MQISHLVVNGCSFTYCEGIKQPNIYGWPALLGKRLGLPVVNLAVGGSGNDTILRKTTEYFYENKLRCRNSNPLYIIALSGATRREEYFSYHRGYEINDFAAVNPKLEHIDLNSVLSSGTDVCRIVDLAYLLNINYYACERKKYIFWNSIVNLFRANNTPYVVGDYMPTYDDAIRDQMILNFPGLYASVMQDNNNVGDLAKISQNYKNLPCGHVPSEAMSLIADVFYDKITATYGSITSQDTTYLTLKEFVKKTSSYHFRHQLDWM